MYAQANNTPRTNKKERRVAVVFRRTDAPVHCGGVESLLLLPEQGSLLTASRDSTIKRWDVQQPTAPDVNPACQASYEAHTDWVNDLTAYQNILFSCSNDRTVRVWQTQSTGTLLSSMCHHSDYVTCLAAAQHTPLVATGGLRGEVFLIDIAAGATHRVRPKPQPQQSAQNQRQYGGGQPGAGGPQADANGGVNSGPGGAAGSTNSQAGIYSLALNASGSLLAAGSSDQVIRLWDIRSGEKIGKLRGHTDNVRCLVLKEDDSLLLSGGADGTIRLWDLSMQRCINTYVVHTDSVRCLGVMPDWSVVYSGGRDKCVFRTRLSTRSAELLVQAAAPVTSLAIDHQAGHMWVATPHSTVHKYTLPNESSQPHSSAHAGSRMRLSHGAMGGGLRKSVETLAPAPSLSKPCATIQGLPAITTHKVLSDRRHVLTKDEEGCVALWDVLAGTEVARYGQVELEAQERALFEARHCPTWFTADNRLGTLAISLEPPQCFNAEDYAQSLGYTHAPDDLKLNYGKIVLECVFAKWKHQVLSQQGGAAGPGGVLPAAPGPVPGPGAGGAAAQAPLQQPPQPGAGPGPAGNHHAPPQQQPQQPPGYPAPNQPQEQAPVYYPDLWPQYWGGVQPVVMCASASGLPWRRAISDLTGAEAEPEDIPTWVGDVVLRNAVVTPREAKCSFLLLPAEGSNLPSLLQSRLTAPRILQVHKVVNYCVGRLAENQLQLSAHPVYLSPQLQQQQQGEEARPAGTEIELVCNNLAVPFEMSLSSVKKFIWGKPDDIVFHFRVRDPHNPAPLPVITPPKQ